MRRLEFHERVPFLRFGDFTRFAVLDAIRCRGNEPVEPPAATRSAARQTARALQHMVNLMPDDFSITGLL